MTLIIYSWGWSIIILFIYSTVSQTYTALVDLIENQLKDKNQIGKRSYLMIQILVLFCIGDQNR